LPGPRPSALERLPVPPAHAQPLFLGQPPKAEVSTKCRPKRSQRAADWQTIDKHGGVLDAAGTKTCDRFAFRQFERKSCSSSSTGAPLRGGQRGCDIDRSVARLGAFHRIKLTAAGGPSVDSEIRVLIFAGTLHRGVRFRRLAARTTYRIDPYVARPLNPSLHKMIFGQCARPGIKRSECARSLPVPT
jgi:hypothetical protein